MAEFLKVTEVLDHLDVKETMMAVEFGCGSADFTIALAKRLKKGRVYGLDIQEEKLSALKSKANVERVHNVFTIHCDLEDVNGSTLPEASQDIVLIPNVLFQSEHKDAIIKEGIRILKSRGQLLIIDWLHKTTFSPKTGMTSPDEMKKIAGALGLSLQKEFAVGDYHYALLFTK